MGFEQQQGDEYGLAGVPRRGDTPGRGKRGTVRDGGIHSDTAAIQPDMERMGRTENAVFVPLLVRRAMPHHSLPGLCARGRSGGISRVSISIHSKTWSAVYSRYEPGELNGLNDRMGNDTNQLKFTTILTTPTTSSYPDHHVMDISTFHPCGREYIINSVGTRGRGWL